MPHFWVPNANLVSDGTLLTPGVIQGGEQKKQLTPYTSENICEITKLSIPPSIRGVSVPWSTHEWMEPWTLKSWWFQNQPIWKKICERQNGMNSGWTKNISTHHLQIMILYKYKHVSRQYLDKLTAN